MFTHLKFTRAIKEQHNILEPVANQDSSSNDGKTKVIDWIAQLNHKKIPKELSQLYPSINQLLDDLNKYLQSQTLDRAYKIHSLLTNELAQWPESEELLQALRQLALDDVNILDIPANYIPFKIRPDNDSADFVTLTNLKQIIEEYQSGKGNDKLKCLNKKLIGSNSLNEIKYKELIYYLTFKLNTKDKHQPSEMVLDDSTQSLFHLLMSYIGLSPILKVKNQAPELYLKDSIQDLIKEIKKTKQDPKFNAEDLIQLNEILSAAKAVLDNPTDADTDKKLEDMTNAAIQFSDQSGAKSFYVLAAVTGVIGAVLLVLGIIALAPSGGTSVLAIAIGAALITFSGMLSSVAYVERERGLPKYVAAFKKDVKDNATNFKSDFEEIKKGSESQTSLSASSDDLSNSPSQ
jgi:hypothetical protein